MNTRVLQRSSFTLPRMDCSSEENLVRMAVASQPGLGPLSFDLEKRQFTAVHEGDPDEVLQRLLPLKLGAALLCSEQYVAGGTPGGPAADQGEARVLKLLLALNATMFFIEIVVGFMAQSTGLIADSLDMFADAAVFALALASVGTASSAKLRAAHRAGWLQVVLALAALGEVARRAVFGSAPDSVLMMAMGALALAVNVTSLVLVARKKDSGAHMKASYIFSATDVIANIGVIVAGLLVAWTGSPYPDFIIGTAIVLVVLHGARRILALR